MWPYFPILSLPTSPRPDALAHCWERYLGTWSKSELALDNIMFLLTESKQQQYDNNTT